MDLLIEQTQAGIRGYRAGNMDNLSGGEMIESSLDDFLGFIAEQSSQYRIVWGREGGNFETIAVTTFNHIGIVRHKYILHCDDNDTLRLVQTLSASGLTRTATSFRSGGQ